MADLKYRVIKSEEQYDEYCDTLEELVFSEEEGIEDEIELLTLLIEDWDRNYSLGSELDPVELVKAFLEDHGLTQSDLAKIAGIGKSYISEILNYKKRMSKKVIRNIADYFKIRQEALNKPYRLEGEKTDNTKEANISKIFSLETGNQIHFEDDEEDTLFVPSQGKLEYAEAK